MGFVLGCFLATSLGAAPLSLDEAVSQALSHGAERQVLVASSQATQAQYAKTALSAGPSVALSASGAETGTSSQDAAGTGSGTVTLGWGGTSVAVTASTDTENNPTTSVKLSQTLWDGYGGGQGLGTARQATLSQEAAALSSAQDLADLVVSVKTAYYAVLSAQEAMAPLQKAVDQSQISLNLIQARYDQKQASLLDLKAAQLSLKTAQTNRQAGVNTLAAGKRTLAHLMGQTDAEFEVASAEESVPKFETLALAQAYAQGHRRELKVLKLTQESYQTGVDLARAAQGPAVGLTASVTQGQAGDATLALGVSASYSVWDSGASSQGVLQYEALVRQKAAEAVQQSRTIDREVSAAWDDWDLKQQQLAVAQLTLENAEANLQVVRAQFEGGTATNKALLEAEAEVADAVEDHNSATVNLRLAILTWKTALGWEEE